MQIKLKYFGEVAEVAGTTEEVVRVEYGINTNTLCQFLGAKYHSLSTVDYRLAINQTMLNKTIELQEEDEVAFLPPFSGG